MTLRGGAGDRGRRRRHLLRRRRRRHLQATPSATRTEPPSVGVVIIGIGIFGGQRDGDLDRRRTSTTWSAEPGTTASAGTPTRTASRAAAAMTSFIGGFGNTGRRRRRHVRRRVRTAARATRIFYSTARDGRHHRADRRAPPAADGRQSSRSDVENLTGGDGHDTLEGDADANVLTGGRRRRLHDRQWALGHPRRGRHLRRRRQRPPLSGINLNAGDLVSYFNRSVPLNVDHRRRRRRLGAAAPAPAARATRSATTWSA